MPITTNPSVALQSEVLEQLMRVSSEDSLLLPFLSAPARSKAAASALGRFLGDVPLDLKVGCPLMVLVSGGQLDPHWRNHYPASEDSLWANRLFLLSLYGPQEALHPYEELERLRLVLLEDEAHS